MPVLTHISKFYAVKDAAVFPMTADPAAGTATYGTKVDIPGIKSVTISGTVKTVELHGDHTLMDSDSVLEKLQVTFHHAKESFSVRATILGGTPSDSGSTPAQIAKWRLLGTDTLFPYYKFEAQAAGVDLGLGDGHLVLWKCKTSNFPNIGLAEDDYETFNVDAYVIPRLADAFWLDVLFNETAVAIS
jgi:hypothetical protein